MDLIIVGIGQFGSALAQIYERQGRRVLKIKNQGTTLSLPANRLKSSIVLLCVPTQALPEVLEQRGDLLRQAHGVVSTAKGLVKKTIRNLRNFKTNQTQTAIPVRRAEASEADKKACLESLAFEQIDARLLNICGKSGIFT